MSVELVDFSAFGRSGRALKITEEDERRLGKMAMEDQLEEELVGARRECDRLRGERNDLRYQASALEAMLAGARAELAEVRRSLARQWAADHAELTAELARLGDELEHAKADRQDLWDTRDKRNHRWMEAVERLTEERDAAQAKLATARRDAADAALALAVDQLMDSQGFLFVVDAVCKLREEIRAGTRPVPGSPESAPAGGEEPSHD
jgi:chromosome segregation ATPase